METNKIIPDVIDEVPPAAVSVRYPVGVEANSGNELTPTQVKDKPSVSWDADPDSYYALVHPDPDSRFREFCHWLVGNIPGSDVSKGDIIFDYLGSGAPKGTGFHRYIFLVYKQPGKLNFDEPRVDNWTQAPRRNFTTRKFAEKYNLGKPIAGNFYLCQWDPYVETRIKFLKD